MRGKLWGVLLFAAGQLGSVGGSVSSQCATEAWPWDWLWSSDLKQLVSRETL